MYDIYRLINIEKSNNLLKYERMIFTMKKKKYRSPKSRVEKRNREIENILNCIFKQIIKFTIPLLNSCLQSILLEIIHSLLNL